eukprot:2861380-Prymnesium_polylepis.1
MSPGAGSIQRKSKAPATGMIRKKTSLKLGLTVLRPKTWAATLMHSGRPASFVRRWHTMQSPLRSRTWIRPTSMTLRASTCSLVASRVRRSRDSKPHTRVTHGPARRPSTPLKHHTFASVAAAMAVAMDSTPERDDSFRILSSPSGHDALREAVQARLGIFLSSRRCVCRIDGRRRDNA